MRRADRLFQIIQILRTQRLGTAHSMARTLGVSERTLYRDIADLIKSGVPIQGEAGVGYAMRKGFDLPPLMFTEEEITAISLGAHMVSSWADQGLSSAAAQVLGKVQAILPERLKPGIQKSKLFAPNFQLSRKIKSRMALLRTAINHRKKISLHYQKGNGELSQRKLRPLCLAFIAPYWLLAGWCELRSDFRNFRLDRIIELEVLNNRFRDEPGRSLEDFLQKQTSNSSGGTNA